MNLWERYYQPSTIPEALDILSSADGTALVIAGGTDLLLDMRQGRHPPANAMIDITRIEEMGTIEVEDEQVVIGAAVTHSRILEDEWVQRHGACLIEACSLIGGPQVRNVATIGGNVANALPAADGTIALLALDAEAEIASPGDRRWEPLENLFQGPGRPSFDRNREIITRFRFSCSEPGQGSTFRRVMRPQGVAIAILNMALWMRLGKNNLIEAVRISVGPGGPRPFRAHKTEQFIIGKPAQPATIKSGEEMLLEEIQLRTSPHRASKSYRELLVGVLFSETFQDLMSRIQAQA